MGFFSKAIGFIKKLIKSILGAIAKLFNDIFGSPLVAALAMFVVGFMLMGPMAFQTLLTNPVAFLSQCMSLTLFVATSLVIGGALAAISAVCPGLGKALGFVFGLLSFIMIGLQVLTMFYPNIANVLLVQQVLGVGAYEFSMLAEYISLAGGVGTVMTLAALAEGVDANGDPKSAYLGGLIDGFLTIPEVVADAADSVVSSASSSLASLAAWAIGGYFAWQYLKPVEQVNVKVEAGDANA